MTLSPLEVKYGYVIIFTTKNFLILDTSDYGNHRVSVRGGVLIVVKTNIPDRSSLLSDVKVFSSEVITVSIPLQIGSILK